jgi:hypothetical protein
MGSDATLEGVMVMDDKVAAVIVTNLLVLSVPRVASIVDDPTATPVTSPAVLPALEMVATAGVDEVQLTWDVTSLLVPSLN